MTLLDIVSASVRYSLLGAGFVCIVGAISCVIGAFVGWGTPRMKSRFLKAAIFCGSYLGLGVAHSAWIFWVIPAWAEHNVRKQQEAQRVAASNLKAEDLAPEFAIRDTRGDEFSLQKVRGKVVLINFFVTSCGPCLRNLPDLQEIHEAYRNDERFAMIVIGPEESEETVAEFQAEHGYSFPMAADPDRAVYSLYANEYMPRFYLVSPQGKIVDSFCGSMGNEKMSELRAQIASQLKALPSR